jgi:hypothetical protein
MYYFGFPLQFIRESCTSVSSACFRLSDHVGSASSASCFNVVPSVLVIHALHKIGEAMPKLGVPLGTHSLLDHSILFLFAEGLLQKDAQVRTRGYHPGEHDAYVLGCGLGGGGGSRRPWRYHHDNLIR